jgi:AraC-like DNA-binding protein
LRGLVGGPGNTDLLPALLDQQRHQRALTLVRGRAMPLSQVAVLLGFADQSKFNLALRRWTGVSPSGQALLPTNGW